MVTGPRKSFGLHAFCHFFCYNCIVLIYHGSTEVIEKPVYGKGNTHNDYGLGFYCTENMELAKEWACQKNLDGYANTYSLDLTNLSVLDLSKEPINILHWISILMQNRTFSPKTPLGEQNLDFLVKHFPINYKEYDVILGYRANDSYFSFASDFLENIIPVQNLASSMKLGSLGMQVVLKSEKAFEQLQFVKSEIANKETYFSKYRERDSVARTNYLEGLRKIKPAEATYLLDIIRNPEIIDGLHL